jgi:putative transcriptional regulator
MLARRCWSVIERLKEKMAGEVTLSEEPGKTMRKWRETFHISQQDLSKHLKVSPSVVSDYESGRRKSPGVSTVRKIVEAILELDKRAGSPVAKQFESGEKHEAVLSIREFKAGVSSAVFMKEINGTNVTKDVSLIRNIHGYTVIDSLRAITSFSSADYLKVYGWSSERALMFTGVKFGRSPMIAIRAHPLKPAMVVYVQPEQVDELAIRLATLEGIPLVTTGMPVRDMIRKLEAL